MYNWTHYNPVKVLFGPGKLNDLHQETLPGKKAALDPAIPIVCITTSAGTASEVDIASVITDDKTQEKTGIFFPSMFPTLSVVDSDLMMSVPAKLTAYQGMDAFFHASETVVNKNVHPMGEMFALKTIELVAKYLPRAVADGNDREAAEEPMIKMARAMGMEDPTSGQDFIKALDDLIASIGCAGLKMSAEGITREELKLYPAKVHEVLGGDITADPLPLSDADYLAIFQNAYKINKKLSGGV